MKQYTIFEENGEFYICPQSDALVHFDYGTPLPPSARKINLGVLLKSDLPTPKDIQPEVLVDPPFVGQIFCKVENEEITEVHLDGEWAPRTEQRKPYVPQPTVWESN